MQRIKCLNNWKNTVLSERNSYIAAKKDPEHVLMLTRVNKSKGSY